MGRVLGLFISNGGVPKSPVDSVEITVNGLVGDSHNNTKHHGGLFKAVCVLTKELLDKLQHEGHPIKPGSTGENVLLEGISLDVGVKFKIGEVELKVLSATSPCWKIASSFTDGDYDRMSDKHYPGDTRWYCKVLKEGRVSILEDAF
ncbi:MAG: MOSC domain-containing protein [Candidatus Poseidoniaceae archaeon]|jgi:MOSC domain-containing protein YiiM|nr:MOSC domain-containing protein [Candidatus Poseidoniaceae archaeon]